MGVSRKPPAKDAVGFLAAIPANDTVTPREVARRPARPLATG
jgi:hypothetical protein